VFPVCCLDASPQGSSIASLRHSYYAAPEASRDFTGMISAAIIGYNYLIIDIFLIKTLPHLAYASFDCFFLVQAREDET
jgi:hypothetical protein